MRINPFSGYLHRCGLKACIADIVFVGICLLVAAIQREATGRALFLQLSVLPQMIAFYMAGALPWLATLPVAVAHGVLYGAGLIGAYLVGYIVGLPLDVMAGLGRRLERRFLPVASPIAAYNARRNGVEPSEKHL